ncbi:MULTISPECIES: DUF1800 family protein [unclassified Bradyrhizobium]|uniref:DUF1800 family protein n=1 Tax=Bradyrhizobium TaxID=374 RepID=UPI001CD4A703|nr:MULTISPECIES: DUF1800 family protein [unclassified Bradyrhizobium]
MARDSQAALVALNRFGFGARGGASGDLVNASSDPRGFVKAELSRPNGVLLEAPGLQSTPQLGQAVFAYQNQVKQAREAAKAAPPAETPPADQNAPLRRNLSLNAAAEITGQMADAKPAENTVRPEAMQPNAAPPAAKPAPQPLNVIQKTFRAEALARLQRATLAECGFTERLVAFWSNHFCISASKGELARIWAGAFEREAIRPHVLGRFADMLRANEGGPVGRLAFLLGGLDGALAEFESGLRDRWRDTVVVVATEFGRTARINGTEGTDHGTGTIALLAGGAVQGGRVIADWPGLRLANLYEGRDLKPTTDLRSVIKGVLQDQFGLSDRTLAETVFPDSASAMPMKGLVV